MKKTLRLRRETLVELGDTQLEVIAGGLTGPTCMPTCQTCYSLDRCPIPTLPIRECNIQTR